MPSWRRRGGRVPRYPIALTSKAYCSMAGIAAPSDIRDPPTPLAPASVSPQNAAQNFKVSSYKPHVMINAFLL
eukprot:5153520-Pyramimonas_sp.AAC.1